MLFSGKQRFDNDKGNCSCFRILFPINSLCHELNSINWQWERLFICYRPIPMEMCAWFFCHWWKIALLIRNKLCARAESGVDYFTIAVYRLHFRVVNLHSLFADRSKMIIKYLDLKPHRWKLFGYWHMFTSCLHT